ncbi:MAG: hypothetical protein ACRDGF_00505 [Chloroflexota bacterium]
MAANQQFPNERFLTVVASSPAAPASGGLLRFGSRIGVALAAQDSDSSPDQAVDFGGVYNVKVSGTDDGGSVAVAVGDPVFWTDADGFLSKKVSGYYAGICLTTVAAGASNTAAQVALLGQLGGGAGSPAPVAGLYKATYDFAVLGGAIGAITLGPGLPAGALIMDGMVQVTTAVVSAGAATVSVGTGASAVDLMAATGKASFSDDALLDIIPVGTAATAILLEAAEQPSISVAVAALTAGKFDLFLRYVRTAV